MKNSTHQGADQHYNPQVAVDQASFLIVANTLSNHPNDPAEAIPTVDAIPSAVGKPKAAALGKGFFSATNIDELEARGVDPDIATGREPHHHGWRVLLECSCDGARPVLSWSR